MQPTFQLPQHVEKNMSTKDSVEILADYFSSISQQYSPLKISTLPPCIQSYLSTPSHEQIIPRLTVYDVYCKILRAKKPNSLVPGDLPKKSSTLRHRLLFLQ